MSETETTKEVQGSEDLANAWKKHEQPEQTQSQSEPEQPLGRTAIFLQIGKGRPHITREHIHSPVKITVDFCPDCGKVLGGGEKKR